MELFTWSGGYAAFMSEVISGMAILSAPMLLFVIFRMVRYYIVYFRAFADWMINASPWAAISYSDKQSIGRRSQRVSLDPGVMSRSTARAVDAVDEM